MTLSVSPRLAACCLALPLTLAVAHVAREAGEYRTHSRDIDTATAVNDECDVEFGHLAVSIESKMAVAAEYAAGRVTLRAAAQRFLERSRGGKSLANLRQLWPAADDEERCAASVVQYLLNAAADTPDGPAVYRRAVAEFQREYGGSATHHSAP